MLFDPLIVTLTPKTVKYLTLFQEVKLCWKCHSNERNPKRHKELCNWGLKRLGFWGVRATEVGAG